MIKQSSGSRENHRLIFLVPLISSRLASDWGEVVDHLSLTINSILRSTSEHFLIGICHNQEDKIPDFRDSRVVAIPANFPPNGDVGAGTIDKRRKVRAAAAYFKSEQMGDNYFMFLDADDLVHRELVAYVLGKAEDKAYLINEGYCYDSLNGSFSAISGEFHLLCGSCFISYFNTSELPDDYMDDECLLSKIQGGRHRNWGGRAKRFGKKVSRIPFPAIVYHMNHSESLRGMKTGFVPRIVGKKLGFLESRLVRQVFL